MEVRPIRDEASYRAMLAQVPDLVELDPAPDSPEGEALEVLGTLVEVYESRHYAMAPPDPIEAIKFCMSQSGLTIGDMVPYIGPRNRL